MTNYQTLHIGKYNLRSLSPIHTEPVSNLSGAVTREVVFGSALSVTHLRLNAEELYIIEVLTNEPLSIDQSIMDILECPLSFSYSKYININHSLYKCC